MSTFAEEYELLYGKPLDFDPVTPGGETEAPSVRLPGGPPKPDSLFTAAPVAAPESFEQVFGGTPRPRRAKKKEPGIIGDVGRAFGAGVVGIAASGAGLLEYGARQLAADESNLAERLAAATVDPIAAARKAISGYSQDILEGMSERDFDAIGREVMTLDPDTSIWRGGPASTGRAIALKVGQMLPATLAMIGGAGWAFAVGRKALAYAVLSTEGLMSAGDTASAVTEEIESMSHEDLLKESPIYKGLIDRGGNEEETRTELIRQAQGAAPAIAGIFVGAVSAVAGKFLEPLFMPASKGFKLGQRFTRGAIAEGPLQEAPQGAVEQIMQNIASLAFDADRVMTEGVTEAAGEGALLGALTGGVVTSLVGRRPTRPGQRDDTTTPPTPPVAGGPSPTEQGELFGEPIDTGVESFEEVFGTGDEPATRPSMFSPSTIDPALRAALDERMQGWYLPQKDQVGRDAALDRQGTLNVTTSQDPLGQQEFNLDRQLAGGAGVIVDDLPPVPPEPVDYSPDMETPLAGDPRQGDLFDTQGEPAAEPQTGYRVGDQTFGPDEYEAANALYEERRDAGEDVTLLPIRGRTAAPVTPTAEPIADIEAQVLEMERPESDRTGVFLSADNIENLQQQGSLEGLLERGVPLVNFDGQGGTLLAKDREAAEALTQEQQAGTPIDRIIGIATGAGIGKPTDGDTVVQRRDESGNIVQERLVANEREAQAVVELWERRYPNFDIEIRSADAALARRTSRVSAERTRTRMEEDRTAAAKKRQATKERGEKRAASITHKGAKLFAKAKQTAIKFAEGKIAGFYPPGALRFRNKREGEQYTRLFNRLVEQELILEQAEEQEAAAYERAQDRSPKKVLTGFDQLRGDQKVLAAERSSVEKARNNARKEKRELVGELTALINRAKPTITAKVRKPLRKAKKASPSLGVAQAVSTETTTVSEPSAPGIERVDVVARTEEQYEGEESTQPDVLLEEQKTQEDKEQEELAEVEVKESEKTGEEAEEIETEGFEQISEGDVPVSNVMASLEQERAENEPEIDEELLYDLDITDIRDLAGAYLEFVYSHAARWFASRYHIVRDRKSLADLGTEYGSNEAGMRKLIRRVRNLLHSSVYGGATKSLRFPKGARATKLGFVVTRLGKRGAIKKRVLVNTEEEATALINKWELEFPTQTAYMAAADKNVYSPWGWINSTVLGRDVSTQDESEENQLKRERRANQARRDLKRTLARADVFVHQLGATKVVEVKKGKPRRKGRFTDIANEKDAAGNFTTQTQNFIYAREYYDIIYRFGYSLLDSENIGTPIIVEMEKINKFLYQGLKLPNEAFARDYSKKLRATIQSGIRKNYRLGELRRRLADPVLREEMNAELLKERLANLARIASLHIRQKNSFYKMFVTPLMLQFSDSYFKTGWASYIPKKHELENLKLAMDKWANSDIKALMFSPLKVYFENAGITFDGDTLVIPLNENEEYEYSPSDKVLDPRFTKRYGPDVAGSVPSTVTQQVSAETGQLVTVRRPGGGRRPVLQFTKEGRDRAAEVEQYGRYVRANEVIKAFREFVSKKRTTILGFIRAEQKLIDNLRQMDLWRDSGGTNDTMASWMGTIARSGLIYRPIRNRIKTLTKEEARAALLRIKSIVFPKALSPGVKERLYGKEGVQQQAQREIDELRTLFNLATDPGPHIAEFDAVALGLANLLNDSSTPTTLNEILTIIVNGIPTGHLYHVTASKLLDQNIGELTINWDERGQLKGLGSRGGDAFGGALWDPDASTRKIFRYILLNRQALKGTDNPTGSLIHTTIHEAVHVATLNAIDTNGTVRRAAIAIQEAGRKYYMDRGVPNYKMPYAFRADSSVAEFIAEAFSSVSVQADLKKIQIDRGGSQGQTPPQSLWTKLVQMVRNLLGMVPILRNLPGLQGMAEPANQLEALMDLEHQLFTREGDIVPGASVDEDLEGVVAMDSTMQPMSDHVISSIGDNFRGLKELWARTKKRIRAPLAIMTERQIHHEHRRHWGPGFNAYDRRNAAWEKRGSEEAALTKVGANVSVIWEGLNEKHGADAKVEYSSIRTEAILYDIFPNLPLSHALNSHLTTSEQISRYRALSQRYLALTDDWKQLNTKVNQWYKKAREEETALNLMNALRGMVTTADGSNPAVITTEKFATTYTVESIKRLNLHTKEGLEKEFPSLSPERVKVLASMGTMATAQKGPYSPLAREGDYVVFAERSRVKHLFKSEKEATAYAVEAEAKDATLDTEKKDLGAGQWQVDVIERDFRTAETLREAAMKHQEMIEEYGKDNVTDVQLKREYVSADMIKNSSTLEAILNKIDDPRAQAALKDWWLQHLSDSAFKKHEIRAKKRRGIDFNIQHRNFVNYIQRSAHHRAHLKYGWELADAERDMETFLSKYKDTGSGPSNVSLGKVLKHIKHRNSLDVSPATIGKYIKKATELGQLAMLVGPSFWMINLTQPWMVTYPWLAARFGYGESLAALKHAQGVIIDPLLTATKDSLGGLKALRSKQAANKAFDVLDQIKSNIRLHVEDKAEAAQYISMIDEITGRGGLELTQIGELRDIGEGIDSSAWGRIMDAGRVMSHITEVNNRVLTAIAAYNLASNAYLKEHKGDMDGAHAAGVEKAQEAVNTTQFGYGAANKSLLFQPGGPLGRGAPLVFQFMQWSQHMYAMLIGHTVAAINEGTVDRKTALKTLAGLFATHLAVGGAIGVALQPIKWAIGALLWATGDDDDPITFTTIASGEAFNRWSREGLTEAFGQKIGHAFASGIPAALGGPDLSDRMALGTLYFIDLKTETSESTIGSIVEAFGGPMVSISTNGLRGIGMIADGDIVKGIQFMVPSKMLKDLIRTYRFAHEGLVNNAGDTILDADGISGVQLFMQAVGFRPAEISDYYSRQALIKDTEFYGIDRKNELLKRYRTADSIEDSNRVLEEISAFNEVFPAAIITRSTLIQTLRGKIEREVSHQMYGASLRGRARIYGGLGDYYGLP